MIFHQWKLSDMFWGWKYAFWVTPRHSEVKEGTLGSPRGDQPKNLSSQKILLVKVVRCDSLMINIPPIVGVDLMCDSRGAAALYSHYHSCHCQHSTGQGKAELFIINSKTTLQILDTFQCGFQAFVCVSITLNVPAKPILPSLWWKSKELKVSKNW